MHPFGLASSRSDLRNAPSEAEQLTQESLALQAVRTRPAARGQEAGADYTEIEVGALVARSVD